MPVLGAASSSGYAVDKRGVYIPANSLDTWRTARAAHATDRPEVVLLGDSTLWGVTVTDPAYSGIAKIRSLSAAAGYTDGGIGIVDGGGGSGSTAAQYGLATNPVQSNAAQQGRSLYNLMLSQGVIMQSTGQTITYQWTFPTGGGSFRINASKSGDSGSFTYAVDGGATSTITPGTSGGWSQTMVNVTAGSHTLTLTWVSGVNSVDVEILNSVGIVYHRHGVPGAQWSDYIQNSGDDVSNANRMLQTILGATQGGVAVQSTEGTHPAARKVRLAVWMLGINDLNAVAGQTEISVADTVTPGAGGATLTANSTTVRSVRREASQYEQAANLFIQVARAAGADPVLCIPHWKVNQSSTQYGRAGALLSRVLAGVARANSCPLIDSNEALGGPVGLWNTANYAPNGVHLRAAGYDVIFAGLFNNIINV